MPIVIRRKHFVNPCSIGESPRRASGRVERVMHGKPRSSLAIPAASIVVLLVGAWMVPRGSDSARSAVPTPTGTWQLATPSSPSAVEGYASEVSVAPGDTLHLHVSTSPAALYIIEIYR